MEIGVSVSLHYVILYKLSFYLILCTLLQILSLSKFAKLKLLENELSYVDIWLISFSDKHCKLSGYRLKRIYFRATEIRLLNYENIPVFKKNVCILLLVKLLQKIEISCTVFIVYTGFFYENRITYIYTWYERNHAVKFIMKASKLSFNLLIMVDFLL
jgi:hypothetical protein